MKCPEYKLCADYRPERIRCCFMYGSCKTRKDIETARAHLREEQRVNHLLKLVGHKYQNAQPHTTGNNRSLDAFEDVEVWRGDTE
jgi:hypothetical protein